MSDGPWIKFYPADWLTGTRGMSAAEIGVYITLVATMYEKGGAVILDTPRLARACGLPAASFSKILDHLIDTSKITSDGSTLFNARAQSELVTRQLASVTAANSARARWEKDKQNQSPVDADAMPNVSSRARARNQKSDIRVDQPSVDTPSASPAKGTRLSDEWVLPKSYGEWALAQGLPRERILIEADKMKNWSINAGKIGVKKDWFAAWKNWVQKAIDDLPRSRGGTRPLTGLAAVEAKLREELASEGYAGKENLDPETDARLPLLAGAHH